MNLNLSEVSSEGEASAPLPLPLRRLCWLVDIGDGWCVGSRTE